MEGADIASTDKDGFTALHWASDKGHLEVVVQLLEKGANRDAKNKDGRKPLHLAAHSGHEPVVEKLLEAKKDKVEKKTDVDSPDKEGWTPLYCAARHNHHTIVKLLIENHKANLEKADRDGWTPLHAAAANGQQESAKELLSLGAKLEAKAGDERTPLYCAARYGYPAVARMLLSRGASVEAPTKEGWTPLHGAVAKAGNGPVVQVLLEFDANIEAPTVRGWTPLICATVNGQEAMVRLLLEKDPNFPNFPTAKVNAQSKNGNTALHAACTNKEQNIVSVLIENGADLTLKNDQHETGFYLIARHGFTVVMRQLFENERIDMAAVLDKTDRGRRALYTAIHWGYGDMALLLLQNGANPGSSDLDENTELHWAAHFGLMEVINELLKIEEGKIKEKNKAGGKVEEAMIDKQNKFGQTATHRAIEMDHEEGALLLLEREATKEATKEATVDIADKKGNTKLHLAASQGQKKVVSRLLEMGANVTKKNKEGETAMHLAARKRQQEVVVILLKSIMKIVEGPTTEWNAMQWAIYYGDPELVRLLVLHVPEVYAKDGRRQSAADLARNLLDVARKQESQPAEIERRDTILERREAVLDWIEAIPTDPKIPELTPLEKPTDEMRQVCDTSLVYMMDFYSQEQRFYSVEKFRYTVSDVVYDRGPENLMSPAAKHRISPLKPDDLLFRWIHLPANNVGPPEFRLARKMVLTKF
jgi:ankyrin repeat protein